MDPARHSPGLAFGPEVLGEPQAWVVHHRGLEYRGEVIVAESLDTAWGRPLDLDFRIVLFTVPRRIHSRYIQDPRIAMAVPSRAPDRLEPLGRELRAIRHRAGQRDPGGPQLHGGAGGIRAARAGPPLRGGLLERAHLLPAGPIPSSPKRFPAGHPRVVGRPPRLERARTELPIDATDFPEALTAKRIGDLYRGLFQGDPDSAEVARCYAPGLGLSRRDSPLEFNASQSRVVEAIRAELESRGGEVSVDELLRAITAPLGLTRTLALLYLISFVRHAHAEMTLDLDEVPAKHITWDLVSEVPFPSLLGPGLGIVRLHPTLAWDTVLPYATLLVEGLESEGGDEQQERLLDGLRAMEREITTARDALDSLRAGLEPAPAAALEVLDRLGPLCGVSDYRELHYEAQRGFGGPSSLKEVLVRYERVRLLIHLAPDIARTKRYLDLMSFGRMHMELALARDAILARIDPEGLLRDPSLWGSIEESFGQMCERYAIAYAAHHESYNQEALELSHRLERLAPQVNALVHFGEILELGEPVGGEVPGLFKDLSDSLHVCLVDGDELDLGDVPYCQACGLRMDQDIARRDAALAFAALDRTMREYNRRLSSHSVRRTLAHPNKEQLDKFVTLVQVADPSALANVLDDDVVAFLRRFLSASR